MPNPYSPDAAPIDPDQDATPMNTTPTSPPPLWQLEEADREAVERARVAEWVAEHVDPVTAALARAVAAEVGVEQLRAGLEAMAEDHRLWRAHVLREQLRRAAADGAAQPAHEKRHMPAIAAAFKAARVKQVLDEVADRFEREEGASS